MFKEHNFSPICYGVPTVKISEKAFDDMASLVEIVGMEVGWLGTAYLKKGEVFIDEVFLPSQECHAATTELTTAGLAELGEKLCIEDAESGKEVKDYRMNHLRFWGHSHVNMDTSPSGQDKQQMEDFHSHMQWDWGLRGIFNKNGKAQFAVYYFDLGLVVEDVRWEVIREVKTERHTFWQSQVQEKVARLSYTTGVSRTGGGRYAAQNTRPVGGGQPSSYHGRYRR